MKIIKKDAVILAHYYAPKAVQLLADKVGDSLELSMFAKEVQADRIVFAGVRFMAETAKILNPEAEVILPDSGSTCSLVEQTDITELSHWVFRWSVMSDKPKIHVAYINSSVQHKALADVICTSRNVVDICKHYAEKGYRILFSPDRNMGAYLKYQYPEWDIEVWNAVCEVHDKFKEDELDREWRKWTDGPKYLIAHPESPLPVLKRANFVGSTTQMINWVKEFPYRVGTIYVATEDGLLDIMSEARPELDLRLAPMYTGCQCNSCPYMKKNTVANVTAAALQGAGEVIEIDPELIDAAKKPIDKMLSFQS